MARDLRVRIKSARHAFGPWSHSIPLAPPAEHVKEMTAHASGKRLADGGCDVAEGTRVTRRRVSGCGNDEEGGGRGKSLSPGSMTVEGERKRAQQGKTVGEHGARTQSIEASPTSSENSRAPRQTHRSPTPILTTLAKLPEGEDAREGIAECRGTGDVDNGGARAGASTAAPAAVSAGAGAVEERGVLLGSGFDAGTESESGEDERAERREKGGGCDKTTAVDVNAGDVAMSTSHGGVASNLDDLDGGEVGTLEECGDGRGHHRHPSAEEGGAAVVGEGGSDEAQSAENARREASLRLSSGGTCSVRPTPSLLRYVSVVLSYIPSLQIYSNSETSRDTSVTFATSVCGVYLSCRPAVP